MSQITGNLAARKQRDQTLDILKGIGIALMVVGHSGVPYVDFIYLFHMALFFMASGYVWSDRKVSDAKTLLKSLRSRLMGLWLPFVLCNGLFTLSHNLWAMLGVSGQQPMSMGQTAAALVKNLLFAGDTRFGGATWFLRTLFLIYAAHMLLRYIAVHWKYGNVLFYGAVALTLVGTAVTCRTLWKLPLGVQTCFSGYTAFLLGMLVKKIRLTDRMGKFSPLWAVAAFGVLLLLNPLGKINPNTGNVTSLLFYAAASLSGWVMVWGVASLLKGAAGHVVAYCGNHSIWIVTMHFLAFKPVILAYLLISGGSMTNLTKYPILWVKGLWPVYALAGIVLPLATGATVRVLIKYLRSLRK